MTYAISAAAQAVFGPRQLTEALLMAAAFGLGAVLTLRAGVMLTGSIVFGLAAALVEVLVFPFMRLPEDRHLLSGGGRFPCTPAVRLVRGSYVWPDSSPLPH